MSEELDETECGEAASELVAAAVLQPELAAAASLDARDQRRIYRETKRLVRGYRREGCSFDECVARATNKIARDPGFAGILAVIAMAVLAATVQYFTRKFWERWLGIAEG